MSSSLMKWLGMLLIWLLFALITFHTCVKQKCCADKNTEVVAPAPAPVEEVQRYPIDFQWNSAQAYTNEGYDDLRKRLIGEMTDDNKLVITGNYYESEAAPDGFKTMGMARATAIRNLFADMPDERFILTDSKIPDNEAAQTGYFSSHDIKWKAADAEEGTEIVQLSSKHIAIRFPFSSVEKDRDPAVDDYLSKLAERMAQTTERVSITGHTDNKGPSDANMNLSERRAKYIRDILVDKGISVDRMDIKWEGEENPTSSNDTEEGRHNNRRVELQILD